MRRVTIFTVEGPRQVPVYAGKGGRTITDENVQSFWLDNDDLSGRRAERPRDPG